MASPKNRRLNAATIGLLFAAGLAGCDEMAQPPDADVVVLGAGIAGLAAALEASEHGATVIVVETNSVPGGHAVKAGGFALVATALQKARGHADSPEIAAADLMDWGVDGDPEWITRYASASGPEVYEWLSAMGTEFRILIPTPEASVPRFHFTQGTAVNVVLPMLAELKVRPGVTFRLNTRAEALVFEPSTGLAVEVLDTRAGSSTTLRTASIIIATGGFQGHLETVRAFWPAGTPWPSGLLTGADKFADGSGISMAKDPGDATHRMDQHVSFPNGLRDPRSANSGSANSPRALAVSNDAGVWLDDEGRPFVNENAPPKVVEAAVLRHVPEGYWLVFSANAQRRLRVRDAAWLSPETIRSEILQDPAVTIPAADVAELAMGTGMLPDVLRHSLVGIEPPYLAMRLLPMTRKNLGGISIDAEARVLHTNGNPISGLFAAGEATGVAGINGSHGMSGTFLGPSVWLGRIAGRSAATYAANLRADRKVAASGVDDQSQPAIADPQALPPEALPALIAADRAGYWHFGQVHQLVLERGLACTQCHETTKQAMITRSGPMVAGDSCIECH
jgi:predicted oxidoreductase